MLSFFPRGVLDEILNLIESVSEGFPSYSYTSTVWSPHTVIDIQKVEAVQRRAAKWVCKDYSHTSSVPAMLEDLEAKTHR